MPTLGLYRWHSGRGREKERERVGARGYLGNIKRRGTKLSSGGNV